MQFYSHSAVDSLRQAAAAEERPSRREDVTYQAVTVATILFFFASLWIF
jgi:hypothetical protein